MEASSADARVLDAVLVLMDVELRAVRSALPISSLA